MDQLLIIVLIGLGVVLWFLGRRLWWGKGPLFVVAFALALSASGRAYAQSSSSSTTPVSSASAAIPLEYSVGMPYASVYYSAGDTIGGNFGTFNTAANDYNMSLNGPGQPPSVACLDYWTAGYNAPVAILAGSPWTGPSGLHQPAPSAPSSVASVLLYDFGTYLLGSCPVAHGYTVMDANVQTPVPSDGPSGFQLVERYVGVPSVYSTLYVLYNKGAHYAEAWVDGGAHVVRYISGYHQTNSALIMFASPGYDYAAANGVPFTLPCPTGGNFSLFKSDESIAVANVIFPPVLTTQPTTQASTQPATQPAIYQEAANLLGQTQRYSTTQPESETGLYDKAYADAQGDQRPTWLVDADSVAGFSYPQNATDAALALNRLPSVAGVNFGHNQNQVGLGETDLTYAWPVWIDSLKTGPLKGGCVYVRGLLDVALVWLTFKRLLRRLAMAFGVSVNRDHVAPPLEVARRGGGIVSDIGLSILQHFVTWLLNPETMLDGAMSVVGYLMDFVAHHLMTGQASEVMDSSAAFFQSGPFKNGLGLMAYICSPFITPEIFLACCAVMLDAWFMYLIITIAFAIKGWITGTGA